MQEMHVLGLTVGSGIPMFWGSQDTGTNTDIGRPHREANHNHGLCSESNYCNTEAKARRENPVVAAAVAVAVAVAAAVVVAIAVVAAAAAAAAAVAVAMPVCYILTVTESCCADVLNPHRNRVLLC